MAGRISETKPNLNMRIGKANEIEPQTAPRGCFSKEYICQPKRKADGCPMLRPIPHIRRQVCSIKSAMTIARTLASNRISPKGPGSGLRMLTYFMNRAGRGLSAERPAEPQKAKVLLRVPSNGRKKRRARRRPPEGDPCPAIIGRA